MHVLQRPVEITVHNEHSQSIHKQLLTRSKLQAESTLVEFSNTITVTEKLARS
jgi:hypothetical protein